MGDVKKFIRKNYLTGIFSILSLILGIVLTKFFDKVYPDSPTVIKEISDSVTVKHLHEYVFKSKDLSVMREDSIKQILLKKLQSLEEIENYQILIDKKLLEIESRNRTVNEKLFQQYYNSILEPEEIFNNYKGVTHSNLDTEYLVGDCPDYEDESFIFISFQLSDTLLFDKIASVAVLIIRDRDEENQAINQTVAHRHFHLKKGTNVLRIPKPFYWYGRYKIVYGVTLKKDKGKEFPDLQNRTCYIAVIQE